LRPTARALPRDIDGTLAELVDNPATFVSTRPSRRRCRASPIAGGALALITGRAITNADRLFRKSSCRSPASTVRAARRDGVVHLTPHPATLDRLR